MPPAWLGVPRSWRAQRALLLARLPHAAQPANAKAQRRLAARMAIARCRGSEGSGYATHGFANHAASRPGRRAQGRGRGRASSARARHSGHVCQPSARRRLRAPAALCKQGAVPPRPSNPRRKRRTRAPALGVPARHQPRQPKRPPVPCAQPTANPGLRAQRGAPPESALRPLRLEEGLPEVRPSLPDCIVVQLGVARGEAHMANSSQAHWRSGSRGNCSSRWRSSCARVVALARTYSEWPTGVPNTSRPHSARGRSPRHTSVPSSATPGGGRPPARL